MKARKLFGTDGIRGEANQEPMSVDTILRVGRAAACVFRRDPGRRHQVLIGKDTRLSGYMFETALASGLCSMGVDVILVGPIPTPGVAFLTASMRADCGVVISASHNPYTDNGIKLFGPDGYKLPDKIEEAIEALVASDEELNSQRPPSDEVGKAQRLDDARGRYISYLKFNFPEELSLKGLKIVIDCAHGAAYKIGPTVLEELGAGVEVLAAKPNGKNINDGCGAVHPEKMIKKVKTEKADLGIALDGDGDRLVVCDSNGRLYDGDEILAILARPMRDRRELGKGIVGTVMSNFGFEKYLQREKISFFRAPVGDRYVVEKMKEVSARLGGEPSGHLVCLNRSTTGDGLLSALLLLAELQKAQKPLAHFSNLLERFPQEQRNVLVKEKKDLQAIQPVAKAIEDAEKKLNGSGRVLVRYSGTEPKVRVMVEGENPSLVKTLADQIATAVQNELGG